MLHRSRVMSVRTRLAGAAPAGLPREINGPALDEIIDAELVERRPQIGNGAREGEDSEDITRPEDI